MQDFIKQTMKKLYCLFILPMAFTISCSTIGKHKVPEDRMSILGEFKDKNPILMKVGHPVCIEFQHSSQKVFNRVAYAKRTVWYSLMNPDGSKVEGPSSMLCFLDEPERAPRVKNPENLQILLVVTPSKKGLVLHETEDHYFGNYVKRGATYTLQLKTFYENQKEKSILHGETAPVSMKIE